MMELVLDHLVINARWRLEDYEKQYQELGFIVTSPSKHSLGSVNQSIVFDGHYLELIGLGDGRRKDLLESHEGIDGLVFKMMDPDVLADDLKRALFAFQPLQHFSRPIHGDEQEARFSVIRLVKEQFREGRVYFCQHHTPKLIWRASDMAHPNGVTGIKYLHIASSNPVEALLRYSKLGSFAGFGLKISLSEELGDYFEVSDVESDRFTAITFRCNDIEQVEQFVKNSTVSHYQKQDNRLWFRTGQETILEFES